MGEGSRPAFACQRCGLCCRGRGGVWLAEGELMAVGARLGVSSADLRERYLLPKPGQGGGQRLEVGVGPDGWCLFYQGGCAIHPAKPAMCRLWPFFRWPLSGEAAFKEAASHCPGLRAMDYQGFLAAYEDFKMRMPGESGACGEEVPKET